MANRWSVRPFFVRMRYDLGCSHLWITFPFLSRDECFFVFFVFFVFLGVFFETWSWYKGFFILGSNVCNSRFISFVAGDGVLSWPGAARKASNDRSLSSPDFKHFNRVLFAVRIVLSTMPFDSANSGLLV